MSDTFSSAPPSPEEFQKRLSEFMRQHFKSPGAGPFPYTGTPVGAEPSPAETSEEAFKFDYRPKEVKAYLDRFVIQQEEAKKVLSVALCDHYHHVRLALAGKDQPNYAKQNLILLGPTGVVKTY